MTDVSDKNPTNIRPCKNKLWVVWNIYLYIIGANLALFFIYSIIPKIVNLKASALIENVWFSVAVLVRLAALFFAIKLGVGSVLEKSIVRSANFLKISLLVGVAPIIFGFLVYSWTVYNNLDDLSKMGWYILPRAFSDFIIIALSGILYGIFTYYWLGKLSSGVQSFRRNLFGGIILSAVLLAVTVSIVFGGILALRAQLASKERDATPEKMVKNETADWKTYRNEEYGLEMEYPKDWKVSVGGMGSGTVHFQDPVAIGTLVLWKIEDYSSFKERMDSVKQFKDSSNVEKEKEEKIILDGIEADKISYTLTQRIPLQSGPSKEIHIFINKEQKLIIDYVISLYPTWVWSKYEEIDSEKIEKDYSDIFNQMLSTFKFLE